jgi:hypothetical protein
MASPAPDFSLAFSQISDFGFSFLGALGVLAVKIFFQKQVQTGANR